MDFMETENFALECGCERGEQNWTVFENLMLACAVKNQTRARGMTTMQWIHSDVELDWAIVQKLILDRLGQTWSIISPETCAKQYFKLVTLINEEGSHRKGTSWGDDTDKLIVHFARLRFLEIHKQQEEQLTVLVNPDGSQNAAVPNADNQIWNPQSVSSSSNDSNLANLASDCGSQLMEDQVNEGNTLAVEVDLDVNAIPEEQLAMEHVEVLDCLSVDESMNPERFVMENVEVRHILPVYEPTNQLQLAMENVEFRECLPVNDPSNQELLVRENEVRESLPAVPVDEPMNQEQKLVTKKVDVRESLPAVPVDEPMNQEQKLVTKNVDVRESLPVVPVDKPTNQEKKLAIGNVEVRESLPVVEPTNQDQLVMEKENIEVRVSLPTDETTNQEKITEHMEVNESLDQDEFSEHGNDVGNTEAVHVDNRSDNNLENNEELLISLLENIAIRLGPQTVNTLELPQRPQNGIKRPMTFGSIKEGILSRKIITVAALRNSVSLLFFNVFMVVPVNDKFREDLLGVYSTVDGILETAQLAKGSIGTGSNRNPLDTK